MHTVLLIDFGSTYTKVCVVDTDEQEVLATASSYTTVETDINNGLHNALKIVEEKTGIAKFDERFACSSAAGGLKMCASGLVPELTVEAAKLATLGAGAKLIDAFAYEMTKSDIRRIEALKPDIFLLTGGTDGGNTKCIIHNAGMLANSNLECPILIAGNRNAAEDCAELLREKNYIIVENVMPKFNELNIEPAKQKIREVFLNNIVNAKGLSTAKDLLDSIMIPTPAAMLESMKLLSVGVGEENGIGDFVAIDVGGATTDVYSMAEGLPQEGNVVLKGFQEPFDKRTVEGDIGMRYSAVSLIENMGIAEITTIANVEENEVMAYVENFKEDYGILANTEKEKDIDDALAAGAIKIGVDRHSGRLERFYTLTGEVYAQTGKDLRTVKKIIFTGGSLIHAKNPKKLLDFLFYKDPLQNILSPDTGTLWIDEKYILASMGILAKKYPEVALRIMKKELVQYE